MVSVRGCAFMALALAVLAASNAMPVATSSNGITYTAAVVQSVRLTGDNATAVMLANLKSFEEPIKQAKAQGAQIIVFPENGIGCHDTSRQKNAAFGEDIPSGEDKINPCTSDEKFCSTRPALCRASCMAREHQIVMVVPFNDRKPCTKTNCHSDNQLIFNTAVAFDEDGLLLARYHKLHIVTPFPVYDVPEQAEVITFKTSFGVTFGMFICFDVLWPEPQRSLQKLGVTDIAFPTSWTNLPPILLATEVQRAWSLNHNTNLLASNNAASRATSGSGIWQNGVGVHYFEPSYSKAADVKVLVHNVTSTPKTSSDALEIEGTSDEPIDFTEQRPAKGDTDHGCGFVGIEKTHCRHFDATRGAKGSLKVTHNTLTCSLDYEINDNSDDEGESHALIAFSGVAWFLQALPIEICAVIKCASKDMCIYPNVWENPDRLNSTASFKSFSVKGTYGGSVPKGWIESFYPLASASGGDIVPKINWDAQNVVLSSDFADADAGTNTVINAGILGRLWNVTSA